MFSDHSILHYSFQPVISNSEQLCFSPQAAFPCGQLLSGRRTCEALIFYFTFFSFSWMEQLSRAPLVFEVPSRSASIKMLCFCIWFSSSRVESDFRCGFNFQSLRRQFLYHPLPIIKLTTSLAGGGDPHQATKRPMAGLTMGRGNLIFFCSWCCDAVF